MIAHLAKLHQHSHHRQKRPASELLACVSSTNVIFVQKSLPLAQRAGHDVEVFLGHLRITRSSREYLLLHLALQSTENERTKHFVETMHESRIHTSFPLDHLVHWVAEPKGELASTAKESRHEKVHERPQFHETVLQRSSGEQKSSLCVEMQQNLPSLRLEVLNVVSFVEHHIDPLLATKHRHIPHCQLIRGDAHLERCCLRPSFPLLLVLNIAKCANLPLLRRSKVRENLHCGAETLKFALPVQHRARGNDDQMRAPDALVCSQISQQRDGLQSLPETHFIRQNPAQPLLVERNQPLQPLLLIRTQLVTRVQQIGGTHLRLGYIRSHPRIVQFGSVPSTIRLERRSVYSSVCFSMNWR